MKPLEELTAEDFQAQLGSTFDTAVAAGRTLALELVEARVTGGAWKAGGRTAFALLFRGPAEAPLHQGTFRMRHAVLGELDVFLVPVARQADGFRYEAIFN